MLPLHLIKRFYKQDIRGSLAHVAMLAKQGILTEEEKEQITDGLNGILEDVESGKLEISDKYEDIHSFVEATSDRPHRRSGKETSHRTKQK